MRFPAPVAASPPPSVLWAKTGPHQSWHPLGAHMTDAALVGTEIWKRWLAPATRRWLSEPLGGEDQGMALLTFLAGCHDLGKASPAFQVQEPWLAQRVEAAGFPFLGATVERQRAPHALVSAAAMVQLLQDRHDWSLDAARRLAAIVGGHHGRFPDEGFAREPRRRPDLHGWAREGSPWMTARGVLLAMIAETAGADEVLRTAVDLDLGRPRELALAGYVVLADWIASNAEMFPLSSKPFDPSYADASAARAAEALNAVGWQRWEPANADPVESFAVRFGFTPNGLQQAVAKAVMVTPDAGLVVIEAPMGVGKTEAALTAAEALASSQGLGGLFVGLPTQATATQMLTRVTQWLRTLGPGRFVVELAHGKARQVDEYQRLLDHGTPSCVGVDGDSVEAEVVAASWFGGPKRRLLAPFVIGTVDQVLVGAAKVRHVALRHVGLEGKVVVVDEVHAYDAYMSVFLRQALRWLGAAGVPVVLMSATLPPASRQELIDAYAGQPVPLGDVGYPSVTTLRRSGGASTVTVPDAGGPSVDVDVEVIGEDDSPNDDTVARAVAVLAGSGANVLVIRNTVIRAQRTYRQIAGRLGEERVTLLHARFTAGRRLAIEQDIVARFGRAGDRPTGHVVVGTQVLEQSLDLDFDALATDLAPSDLVFQRLGRVHRHDATRRPDGWKGPRLLLAGIQPDGNRPPVFPRGSSLVYGDHLLLRTAAVLLPLETIAVPGDIQPLVATVYGDEMVVPAEWAEAAVAAALEHNNQLATSKARAETYAIGDPDRSDTLLELCRAGIGNPSDDDPTLQAAVRDAEPTVEVALGRKTDSNAVLFDTSVVDPDAAPQPEEVDAILSATLRLPPWITAAALDPATGPTVPAGWAGHPWLSNLPLIVLDDFGEARIGRRVVRYSNGVGLEVQRDGGDR
ncbi:MAG: CRISPR-associated helicase Cas3' [Actinomycetota bacterium]|nr:CRISPR-associated helicase Cas3' [Actinomycetota bacterium]